MSVLVALPDPSKVLNCWLDMLSTPEEVRSPDGVCTTMSMRYLILSTGCEHPLDMTMATPRMANAEYRKECPLW
jgi:hypothetical protein